MTVLLVRWRGVSPAGRLGFAVLCLALASGGGALFLLSPARARTAALEARRATLQGELAQARAAVANLARSRLDGVELQRRLELITQQLPTEREIAPLYRRLYDAAASTGLAIALFQPREARVQDYYTEIPIAVTAEGTYHQLGAFLARIAELPRVVTVGALKMTAVERPPASLRAEMTLATYVYRRAGASPATGPAGARPPAPASIAREPSAREAAAPGHSSPSAIAPAPVAAATSTHVSPSLPAPPSALPGVSAPPYTSPGAPYSPRGRRDPFGLPALPTPENANAAARPRPTIASATLTGIVRGPEGLLALVETPDGLGYILRTGDGIEEARVIRIGVDSVVFSLPPAMGRAAEQIVLALGRQK